MAPLHIARACRVEIDLPAAPGRVLRQMIADAAQLPKIIGPEIHTAECIFRAGILAVFQNFMRPYAVGGLRLVERDHKKFETPVCFVELFLILCQYTTDVKYFATALTKIRENGYSIKEQPLFHSERAEKRKKLCAKHARRPFYITTPIYYPVG